jgi:hypothetical protein
VLLVGLTDTEHYKYTIYTVFFLLSNAVKPTITHTLIVIIIIWGIVALKPQTTPTRNEVDVRNTVREYLLDSSEELSWVECHKYQMKKVHSSF